MTRKIEAARETLREKKAKRESKERERDVDTLKPDDYRAKHGRCPPGYRYDPLTDSCESSDPEPGEPKEEQTKEEREEVRREQREREAEEKKRDEETKEEEKKDKEKKDETPEQRLARQIEKRKARRQKLRKLFDEDPEAYDREVDRMRETGELPDEETSKLIAKVKNIDSLPDEILNDKEKLAEIIQQQDAQREHEKLVLERTEKALEDFARKRKIAQEAGRKPPTLNPLKLLRDIEEQYGRPLAPMTEKTKKFFDKQEDFIDALTTKTEPGKPAYWLRKMFERITRPLPTWTPGKSKAAMDFGLDKLTSASVDNTVALLDAVAQELEARGSSVAYDVDVASDRLDRSGADAVTAFTSPGIVNLEPRELGFPPYDKERPIPKFIPNAPSGRRGFPPFDGVDNVPVPNDVARDAKMKGFPPYDGKGEIHDSETIGLPPYNRKLPHMGRGFPPFLKRRSVYDERLQTVREAVR